MRDKSALIRFYLMPKFFILRPHHQTFVFRWLRIYFYEPSKNDKRSDNNGSWMDCDAIHLGWIPSPWERRRKRKKSFLLDT